jgi:hypothetical protein
MNFQPRTRERRRRTPHCAHSTTDLKLCQSIPAWRCETCRTVVCGVHIDRNERGAVCRVCGNHVERLRKRRGERRMTPAKGPPE